MAYKRRSILPSQAHYVNIQRSATSVKSGGRAADNANKNFTPLFVAYFFRHYHDRHGVEIKARHFVKPFLKYRLPILLSRQP